MERYICPDCGTNMETNIETGITGTFLKLKCPKCCFALSKSRYDFIRDLEKHCRAEISQEQTKKAVVLSKSEVIGICKSKKPGTELVCQFKNGIDTQRFLAVWVEEWLTEEAEKHGKIYGETWRCWTAMPTAKQEANTPWDTQCTNEVGQGKPPLGCPPHYTYVCSRIEDLCNAIVRCYADWKPNHNKIALWCKEIMYLNEMDRSLRYDEKRKVWKDDEDEHFQEVP